MAEATGTLKRKPIPVSRTGSPPRESPIPASAARDRSGAGADHGVGLVAAPAG